MATYEPEYNKINSRCGTNYGFYFTDHFTAEIGWEWRAEKEFQLFVCSELLRNFTVSDDEVSGEVCAKATGIGYNTYYLPYTSNQNGTYPVPRTHVFDVTQNPDNGHHIRMAFYLREVINGDLRGYAIDYEFYDVDARAYQSGSVNGVTMSRFVIWTHGDFVIDMYHTSTSYDEYRDIDIFDIFSVRHCGLDSSRLAALDSTGKFKVIEISTNIPVFDTLEHAKAYLADPTITEGLLNGNPGPEPTPEEEYEEQFNFWYIKNKWGHNTRNVDSSDNNHQNYRFYPKRKGICFIKHTPTASEPYDRILYNYSNYNPYHAAWGETADEDFEPNPGVITTHFLSKSISFGPNNYYTKFDFDTNIPLWNTQQDADDYFNGLKDISEADNYAYISRQDNEILNPDLPGTDIDESTTLGTNGMRYSYGNRLYEITNVELSNLMTELFQPATVQSVIDGNKLFGSNTMEAVSGVIYIPLTSLDAVCDLGSLANVRIGSWESQQAKGRRIIKNEGTIDCGTFFYNRVYNDYRDYEPYNLLFANLPFCGCHQLTISKYIDKTVGVSYNIDITTGAIVCKLTADGLLVDIFDGTCGASRPISATDNNAYINNVVGAITGASSQASGSIEGITNTVGVVGKAASAGSVAVAGAALGGALFAGGVAASGVYTAYQVKNAVDNPPQMHRGSLVGNLAYNLNTKPTFLFYSKRTIRPENELAVVGYPSGHGGTIGTFNGFLSCGAVKLANFNGTKAEESELFEILKGGIYI
jgi:hypothetical protein